MSRFPEEFVWGVASSAYQIEGAWDQDGRGPSIWDTYSQKPGNIYGNHNGNIACDHVNRYREDVGIMQQVGARAYRFSISWSRVLPDGQGRLNQKGLDFYSNLVDELLSKGITPYCTLFHWDYPQRLFERGGWLNADSPQWFAEYTEVIARTLGDRIKHWFTLNEPQVFLGSGHATAGQAPGLKLSWPEWFLALKHTLLAHGRACQALRASVSGSHVSYAPVGICALPYSSSSDDLRAAKEYTFGKEHASRGVWVQRPYLDPVLKGIWPEDFEQILYGSSTQVTSSELETMHQPLDSLGLNFYSCPQVRMNDKGEPEEVPYRAGHPRTAFDWPITPSGIRYLVEFHHERYGLPIFITENGLSCTDSVHLDGHVHDSQRIDFLHRYLLELSEAIRGGADVRGYFQWSIMDNFEWCDGYRQRFGLVHVDYESLVRTIKDSGHWYKTVCDSNGADL